MTAVVSVLYTFTCSEEWLLGGGGLLGYKVIYYIPLARPSTCYAIIYRDIIYAQYPSTTSPPKQQQSIGILRNQQQFVRYITLVSGT